jgi:hypothetical protein
MSVAEILRELNKMPPEAIPEIEAAIQRPRNFLAQSDAESVRPGFDEIAARVFENYRETIARLSR